LKTLTSSFSECTNNSSCRHTPCNRNIQWNFLEILKDWKGCTLVMSKNRCSQYRLPQFYI
jgi:hypothetical protein